MLPILLAATVAQPASNPRRFVEQIIEYELHDNGGVDDPQFLSFFTPTLRRAINRDTSGHPGYVGLLDYDPLCQCQDNPREMRIIAMRVGKSTAAVELETGPNPWTRYRLKLRRIGPEWKVADVYLRGTGSLTAMLSAK
jgi:hypothetical protein